ncbi:hypothetical protein CBL_10456 [Carabus blaptoides fortunei]
MCIEELQEIGSHRNRTGSLSSLVNVARTLRVLFPSSTVSSIRTGVTRKWYGAQGDVRSRDKGCGSCGCGALVYAIDGCRILVFRSCKPLYGCYAGVGSEVYKRRYSYNMSLEESTVAELLLCGLVTKLFPKLKPEEFTPLSHVSKHICLAWRTKGLIQLFAEGKRDYAKL